MTLARRCHPFTWLLLTCYQRQHATATRFGLNATVVQRTAARTFFVAFYTLYFPIIANTLRGRSHHRCSCWLCQVRRRPNMDVKARTCFTAGATLPDTHLVLVRRYAFDARHCTLSRTGWWTMQATSRFYCPRYLPLGPSAVLVGCSGIALRHGLPAC